MKEPFLSKYVEICIYAIPPPQLEHDTRSIFNSGCGIHDNCNASLHNLHMNLTKDNAYNILYSYIKEYLEENSCHLKITDENFWKLLRLPNQIKHDM